MGRDIQVSFTGHPHLPVVMEHGGKCFFAQKNIVIRPCRVEVLKFILDITRIFSRVMTTATESLMAFESKYPPGAPKTFQAESLLPCQ